MCCALMIALPLLLAQESPDKALKSKDPLERLAAIEALAANDFPKRERLLLTALKDDDWEVVERAAVVLGDVGTKAAMAPLVKLALEGPVRRVRRHASEALARLDADKAFEGVAKKVTSKEAAAACLAMCSLAPALEEGVSLKPARKALKSKEAATREAAARAMVRLAGEDRAEVLAGLLEHEEVAVRCAAAEAAGETGDVACGLPLLATLTRPGLSDVLERRVHGSMLALLRATKDAGLAAAACAATESDEALALERGARLVGRLGVLEFGVLDGSDALAALERALTIDAESARAAAADALARLGSQEALERLEVVALGDDSARVRATALRSLVRRRPVEAHPEGVDLCAALLGDEDPRVREEAALALAAKGVDAVVKPLTGALRDSTWSVAAVAAVSLGKSRCPGALNPLAKMAASNEDWRLRGAGVVGLGHLYEKEAIPRVIAALNDEEGVVRRTALEYLVSVANRRMEPQVKQWEAWWAGVEKRIVLLDPDEEAARRDRYGYNRSPAEIYAGLDVVVFESRGDHIQNVLDGLGVDHRLTAQGRVAEAEVHARSVFVSNCTGEMTAEDVDRLAWFVRVGGYLFGSCWAVQETIARAVPGALERLPTRGEVLDNVFAAACSTDSPFLEGVFDRDVRPMYALEGAYLIRVVDPERCEVLVDSPECHDRWGGGNLAAWLPVGHGVVLDSVNHFEEQGLARATWLKKPEERQAFAVDHMGLDYSSLREVVDERWWKKSGESAERIKDLSVFRLITNFVRYKRIEGDG